MTEMRRGHREVVCPIDPPMILISLICPCYEHRNSLKNSSISFENFCFSLAIPHEPRRCLKDNNGWMDGRIRKLTNWGGLTHKNYLQRIRMFEKGLPIIITSQLIIAVGSQVKRNKCSAEQFAQLIKLTCRKIRFFCIFFFYLILSFL